MNDDFVSGLRADLVDAAARHGRRGPIRRAARPLHPRAWTPAAAGALAVAATLAAIVVGISALAPPAQRAGRLDVVAVVPLGGQLQDAAYGGGSVWVADYDGNVLRVDPVTRRVLARIPTPGKASAIAADDAAVWVVTDIAPAAPSWLLRIDPRTGRVLFERASDKIMNQVAIGAGAVWGRLRGDDNDEVGRIGRDGAVTGGIGVPSGPSLAAGQDTVWSLADDGTLSEVDAVSGGVVLTLRRAVSTNNDNMPENAVAADADGAWVADVESGTVIRVVGGRILRRIKVAPYAGPIARSDDAVWVATANARRRSNGLARIDPEQGAVTATVDLGSHIPQAIVPVGDAIWVIASDGTATIVRED